MSLLTGLQREGTFLYQIYGINREEDAPENPVLGSRVQMARPDGPPLVGLVIGVFKPDEDFERPDGFVLEILPIGIAIGG